MEEFSIDPRGGMKSTLNAVAWRPLGTASSPGRMWAVWMNWGDWAYCLELESCGSKWQRKWTFKLYEHLPIISGKVAVVFPQLTEVSCSSCILGSAYLRSQPCVLPGSQAPSWPRAGVGSTSLPTGPSNTCPFSAQPLQVAVLFDLDFLLSLFSLNRRLIHCHCYEK